MKKYGGKHGGDTYRGSRPGSHLSRDDPPDRSASTGAQWKTLKEASFSDLLRGLLARAEETGVPTADEWALFLLNARNLLVKVYGGAAIERKDPLSSLMEANADYNGKVTVLAARVRDEIVVPICVKHGVTYHVEDHEFFFKKEGGELSLEAQKDVNAAFRTLSGGVTDLRVLGEYVVVKASHLRDAATDPVAKRRT